jgi:hypothetical protein
MRRLVFDMRSNLTTNGHGLLYQILKNEVTALREDPWLAASRIGMSIQLYTDSQQRLKINRQ